MSAGATVTCSNQVPAHQVRLKKMNIFLSYHKLFFAHFFWLALFVSWSCQALRMSRQPPHEPSAATAALHASMQVPTASAIASMAAKYMLDQDFVPESYYRDASDWPEMDSDLESDANDYDIPKKPSPEPPQEEPIDPARELTVLIPGGWYFSDPIYFSGLAGEAPALLISTLVRQYKSAGAAPLDEVGQMIRGGILDRNWAIVFLLSLHYQLCLSDEDRHDWNASEEEEGRATVFLLAKFNSHYSATMDFVPMSVPLATFFWCAEMVQRAYNNEF